MLASRPGAPAKSTGDIAAALGCALTAGLTIFVASLGTASPKDTAMYQELVSKARPVSEGQSDLNPGVRAGSRLPHGRRPAVSGWDTLFFWR